MKISEVIKTLQDLQNEFGDVNLFVIQESPYSNSLNDRHQFDIKNVKMDFLYDFREKEGYDVPAIIIY